MFLIISADPLACVSQAFREHLLEQALYSLLAPTDCIKNNKKKESMQYTQLLTESSCHSGVRHCPTENLGIGKYEGELPSFSTNFKG